MTLRESLLTKEIEDLKSKLKTKTDELNEVINSKVQVSESRYFYSMCVCLRSSRN